MSSSVAETASESQTAEALDRLEERIFQRMEAKLEPWIERKLQEALSEQTSGGLDPAGIKELISGVLSATLFESGLLEKVVSRVVEQRSGASGGFGEEQAADLSQRIQSDCLAAVRKEAAAAMSNENLKVLIDDKFRAISIYLKTDVIPKAVQLAFKSMRRPPG